MRLGVVLLLFTSPALASSLSNWHQNFSEPKTQRQIVESACRATVVSEFPGPKGAKRFSTGAAWYEIPSDHIFLSSPDALIVTCERGRMGAEYPLNAVSVLLTDAAAAAPIPITDGYARRERVHELKIPGLENFSFVAIERAFMDPPAVYGEGRICDVTVRGTPRVVWETTPAMSDVHWGLSEVDGQPPSEIVARSIPKVHGDVFSGSSTKTWAFRWDNNRFVPYETFESRLNAVPNADFIFGN